MQHYIHYFLNKLHQSAEYISGGATYILSFIGLNMHFGHYAQDFIAKVASGTISLFFTGFAVFLTHYLKVYLETKEENKKK